MTDIVVQNARIWCGRGLAEADTAIIRDGRFAYVGQSADVNPAAGSTVVDAIGRRVVPGLTDSHAHMLATGYAMHSVDLKGVTSVDEAVRRVAARASTTPDGAWITGAGWDQHEWPGQRFPSRIELDAATSAHPVSLTHTSGHCTWVNSVALHAAGISSTTQAPEGGSIDVDEAGNSTGILRDNASKLVANAMPPLSQADRLAAMRDAIAHAQSLGITAVHAMNVGRGEFQALHALHDQAELRLRIRMFLAHEKLDEWIERNLATGDGDDMLSIGGVKFFADGALGSLTAWMHEPYASTSDVGFPLQSIADLERDVQRSLAQGLAPAIHAIGDRANHQVLNFIERCQAIQPELPRRVEHAQLLSPDDVRRFAQLGITVSAQPIHATQDWRKVDREWGARGSGAYVFSSLARSGANLAFGSDTPVETMNPFAGIHAAVTRMTATGEPNGGWYPVERIGVQDALHWYTSGPAQAVRDETRFGCIAEGYAADFVVLSDDILTITPNEIHAVHALETYVAGQCVYRT